MTAIIAMPHFQNVFHTGTTGPQVAVVFSLYTVYVTTSRTTGRYLTNSGSMVGAPFAAVASDRFGRRKAMFAGACVIITGAIVAATSHHFAQLVVSRFILGFGIAIMTVAAPAYSQEIAPPQWRGRATGFYNTGWFGGSIRKYCILI
jgi:MFS family permease